VRNLTAILFLSIVVAAQTPASELLKLPILFEHYLEHKKTTEISFLGYLRMHYSTNHPVDEDYSKDQQLPFRKIDLSQISTTIGLPVQSNVELTPELVMVLEQYIEFSPSVSSHKLSEIWQPPRAC